MFNAPARARSTRTLVMTYNEDDEEEPETLVRALQCAYAATFTPWSDGLPARVLSSVVYELSTSEEAMVGDETPFATTFGSSLSLAPVQAHTGHFATRKDVAIPDDIGDEFIKDHTLFVYSNLHDLWVIDSVMAGSGETWLRDGLKLQAQGTRVSGVTPTLPGNLCLVNLRNAYPRSDPALLDKERATSAMNNGDEGCFSVLVDQKSMANHCSAQLCFFFSRYC